MRKFKTKELNKSYKKFLVRFASGEQYLKFNELVELNPIEEIHKDYFWQEKEVYNKILPILESLMSKNTITKNSKEEFELIERLLPIQRAYNTIKNYKMEIFNRIASGTLCVEDGSVDYDNLTEEGWLVPNKIIIYRQGSEVPQILQKDYTRNIPLFTEEEDRLLNEFKVTTDNYINKNIK